VRASGPGGQNVNNVATAVQLHVRRSPSLPDDVRVRVRRLAGRRLTQEGVLIITAQRHRTQERNRQDALERLVDCFAGRPSHQHRGGPHGRRRAPNAGGWRPRSSAQ
jgi:protein subunit release factor B